MGSGKQAFQNSSPRSSRQVERTETEESGDKETDARLRRRLQNRIAQRNHRQRMRENQKQANNEAQQDYSVSSFSNSAGPAMNTSTEVAHAETVAAANDVNSQPLLATDLPLIPWHHTDPCMADGEKAALLSFVMRDDLFDFGPAIDAGFFEPPSSLSSCHDMPNLGSWPDSKLTQSPSLCQAYRALTGDLEALRNDTLMTQSSVPANNCVFGGSPVPSLPSLMSSKDSEDDPLTPACFPRTTRTITGRSPGSKRCQFIGSDALDNSQSSFIQFNGNVPESCLNDQSNIHQTFGKTALHLAAEYGHDELIRSLLDSGADIDALDKNGFSALHYAARHGHLKAVLLLMKSGANQDVRDVNGWTALHVAAQYGWVDVVEILIKSGGNVNIRTRDS